MYKHKIPGISDDVRKLMVASVGGGKDWNKSHSSFYGYMGASKRSGTGTTYGTNTLQNAWHKAGTHFGYQHGGTLNRQRLASLVSQGPDAPKPAPAPAPAADPRPTPTPAPKPTITPPTAAASAGLVIGNKPTTVSGPSVASQVSAGIEAFKKSEAERLARLDAERKAAEEKKKRADAIAARPNTVEGQAALKITKNISSQLPGMPGYEASGLSTIRNKLLKI